MTITTFTQQHIDQFLESLDNDDANEWYATDREIADELFARFIKWATPIDPEEKAAIDKLRALGYKVNKP